MPQVVVAEIEARLNVARWAQEKALLTAKVAAPPPPPPPQPSPQDSVPESGGAPAAAEDGADGAPQPKTLTKRPSRRSLLSGIAVPKGPPPKVGLAAFLASGGKKEMSESRLRARLLSPECDEQVRCPSAGAFPRK